MSRMSDRAAKVWPQEIADERAASAREERERRFEEARRLADALAEAAGQIPEAIAGAELDEVDRQLFLANAQKLRSSAEHLQASAANRDLDRMHNVLHSIRATCNSCHAQFRELAGPIVLPGAPL